MGIVAVFDPLAALGYAAAILLSLYLFVVVIIFAAVAGGMAFGTHWVNGKTEWAFGKVNELLPKLREYTERGTDYSARPFITGSGLAARIRVTLEAIQRTVREIREPQRPPVDATVELEVAARPLPQATEETVIPEAARVT